MQIQAYNLLPLDQWRRLFGINPWHFWGLVAEDGPAKQMSECLDVVTEYSWQAAQAVGRDDIRDAIIEAEATSREWCGFWPAPRYGEVGVGYPRKGNLYLRQYNLQPNWRQIGIQTGEGNLIGLGVERLTPIDLTALPVYTDTDNDGVDDLFTITLTVPVGTTISQVAVYHSEANRLGFAPVGERWRILPLAMQITGTTLTIKGKSYLVVKPERYEDMTIEGLDAADSTNYVTELAVYLRETDPTGYTLDTSQSVIFWENRPCHGWWCCCAGCSPANSQADPAAIAMAMARVAIRDAELGIIYGGQAAYNATTGFWNALPAVWEPDRMLVRWYAGVPPDFGNLMNQQWATVIARFAAANMGQPICSCQASNKELYNWQFDRADSTSESQNYQISQDDLNNPLGTRLGQIQAWKWFARKQIVTGLLPG